MLDFFFRLYWIDERLNIPSLWEALADTNVDWLAGDGTELKAMIRDDNNPLNIWLPDIHFADGQTVDFQEETITLRPNGVMFWSRHTVATLQQPGFCKWHCCYALNA